MRRAAVRRQVSAVDNDAALVASAARGDTAAFDELYRRNVAPAWGTAYAILHDPDDASDAVAEAFANVLRAIQCPTRPPAEDMAFRPYLLAAVRHAAIDVLRRARRVETRDFDGLDRTADGPEPVDRVVAGDDAALVTRVFAQLPERWRSALWLIDVEELSTSEAGTILGVTPNNAAQLATRARGRLRQEFLQAQVPNHIRPGCRVTVAILGAYAAGTITAARRVRVEAHLAGCAECRSRIEELGELGVALRRALPALPLALALRRAARPHLSLRHLLQRATAKPSPLSRPGAADVPAAMVPHLAAASPVVERVLAGVSAAVLVASVSTMAVRDRDAASPHDPDQAISAPPAPGDGSSAAGSSGRTPPAAPAPPSLPTAGGAPAAGAGLAGPATAIGPATATATAARPATAA
ncbi:MAG: sigma-70 family RNA polymerase sigma factor, partial [Actinobacteria bacterium]|nr:sigma-70 family RNA polymerase sigma factor [Actinomycetota bacterium]